MKKLISLFLSLAMLTALVLPATAVGPADLPFPAESYTAVPILFDPNDNVGTPEAVVNAQLQAAGGVPGQLNVMINGRCVTFPDAVPEAVNGRTMVPLRAAMEALGAQVDYDSAANSARVTLGELSFTHVIGTDLLTLADGSTLQMDVASYARDNRTMVPLRFFSQALDYEVFWDAAYNTAVIVDKDAFIQSIDSRFTILNDMLAKQNAAIDYTQNLQCDAELSGSFTLIDTISGNTDYAFSAGVSALIGREAADVTMSADLSFLSQVLDAMEEQRPQWVDELLKDLSLRIIFSGSSAWLNSPALVQAMKADGVQLPEGDLWFQEDGLEEYTEMPYLDYIAELSNSTLGEMAYLVSASLAELSPFTAYSQAQIAADMAALVIGDDTWTKNGETWQWHMDMDTLDELARTLTGEDELFTSSAAGVTFSADITVQADGSYTFTVDGSMHNDALGRDIAKLTASGSCSGTESEMELRLQVINICELTLKSSATVESTSQAPASQPPAGGVIVDEDGWSLA